MSCIHVIMNLNLTPFQEPRGVMRVLQLIFAICAFTTTANFSVDYQTDCSDLPKPTTWNIDYPFKFYENVCQRASNNESLAITADVSTDAQFFVATGVLAMLYGGFIIFVYAFLDELYKSKNEIPLADFMLTTIFAVLWLSSSAAWANSTSALKNVLDPQYAIEMCKHCRASNSGFNGLHSSLLLGFLNFFLWASDLWFVYKETYWFQTRQGPSQTPIS
uniref:CSON002580 protein n=2 Tax=Culicoides sonorensis TaxID=179676 RepID=A0A336MJD9_CULSO